MSLFAYVAVAAAGVIASGALPPLGAWFLLPLALVPLFALVADSERLGPAFWLGFWFALPLFVLHIWWLPASFSVPFGPLFWLVFPLLLVALAAIWGGTTWLARAVAGRGAGVLALLPALWILVEWARSQGYLGFPWGVFGYAFLDAPIGQLADTVGVYGLGLLATATAALLAAPFVSAAPEGRRPGWSGRSATGARLWLPPVSAVALLALAWFAGGWKAAQPLPPTTHRAVLVQPNADPFARLTAAQAELELSTLVSLTDQGVRALAAPPDLVVWPEGAVLGVPVAGAAGAQRRERMASAAPESTIVFGTRVNENGASYNSVYAMAEGQLVDRYDKRVLVPFGERWPFLEVAAPIYRGIFALFGLPLLTGTTPGDAFTTLATPTGELGAYVCYESVFPHVTATMVRAGATVLVNITNDAWFARGAGARQHFDMGRMRAIETGRYLLRSGNDGITAAVDPRGRTVAELARGTAGTLTVDYALRSGSTSYVRFGGLLVPLLLTYAALAAAVVVLRR